ncbi:MAG: rhamnan synthesis F family protein [Actinomycetota bacterium]
MHFKRRLITIWRIIKDDPSLKIFFRTFAGKLSLERLIPRKRWIPKSVLRSQLDLTSTEIPRFAITVHLHYEEFVDILKSALAAFPFPYDLFITTSSDQIERMCRETFKEENQKVTIRKTPNRGRNFGPLFAEFSEEMSKYEIVIHVHSKKSPHMQPDDSKEWSRALWNHLLSDPTIVRRALIEILNDKEIGLYYPLTTNRSHKFFHWSKNELIAKEWAKNQNIRHSSGTIAFPFGGMFWFRPTALAPLLKSNFTHSDFPEEAGQMDETLQHAIERLVGTVPLELGFKHLVFHARSDLLSTDTSFVGKRFKI